jgi:hypothetical protein
MARNQSKSLHYDPKTHAGSLVRYIKAVDQSLGCKKEKESSLLNIKLVFAKKNEEHFYFTSVLARKF